GHPPAVCSVQTAAADRSRENSRDLSAAGALPPRITFCDGCGYTPSKPSCPDAVYFVGQRHAGHVSSSSIGCPQRGHWNFFASSLCVSCARSVMRRGRGRAFPPAPVSRLVRPVESSVRPCSSLLTLKPPELVPMLVCVAVAS